MGVGCRSFPARSTRLKEIKAGRLPRVQAASFDGKSMLRHSFSCHRYARVHHAIVRAGCVWLTFRRIGRLWRLFSLFGHSLGPICMAGVTNRFTEPQVQIAGFTEGHQQAGHSGAAQRRNHHPAHKRWEQWCVVRNPAVHNCSTTQDPQFACRRRNIQRDPPQFQPSCPASVYFPWGFRLCHWQRQWFVADFAECGGAEMPAAWS